MCMRCPPLVTLTVAGLRRFLNARAQGWRAAGACPAGVRAQRERSGDSRVATACAPFEPESHPRTPLSPTRELPNRGLSADPQPAPIP
eukprot:3040095-Prymnesium_polylepis.1